MQESSYRMHRLCQLRYKQSVCQNTEETRFCMFNP
jgi:hypothetical protein